LRETERYGNGSARRVQRPLPDHPGLADGRRGRAPDRRQCRNSDDWSAAVRNNGLGRYEEARACLDEAITINGEYDDGWAQADVRRMLASVDRAERRFDDALQQLGAALEIFRDYGDRWAEVETLRDLAETYAASGDRTQAKEFSRQAREIVRALQDPVAS